MNSGPKPPTAPRHPEIIVRHGARVEDPYAWLRDPRWREAMEDPSRLAPEIRAHLEAENAYADAILAPTRALQRTLIAEMRARLKETDASVPEPDGPYAYYQRFEDAGEHPIFCRRRLAAGAAEEVLLHGEREAAGQAYFNIADCRHSPDHRLLAYAIDVTGNESYTIRLKDLESGRLLDERLEGAHGQLVWANDGRTLFYLALDAHHRPTRVFRHAAGEPAGRDAPVYEEPDAGFYLTLGKTEDRRFILINAHDHSSTSEVRCLAADAPDAAPVTLLPRLTGRTYGVSAWGDDFILLTNADGAVDFKIVAAPIADPSPSGWRELVPHEPGRLIRAVSVCRDHMARLELRDGLPAIVVRRFADGAEHAVAFDEEAYDLAIVPGREFEATTLRFVYSSPVTPQRVYDYDMAARTRVLRKEQEIPSGHDPGAYVLRRIAVPGHDGARVPVTILHARSTPRDGAAPLLLYGYGAYGFAMPASFAANRFSLVDRGFVYAIAHVRGGTERGYGWYLDGKLGRKTNTFLDFIAAAEALIARGYTSAGRIVAQGRSAGGLLVGASLNMRPDLFGAAIAEVPFVDVLNTMSDPTLPLTPPERSEWGDPLADRAAHRDIAAYSPYDNVAPRAYPPVLATAGVSDPRVTYWEPAKWAARLRALGTSGGPVLLKTNMQAGHAGSAGRFQRLDEVALAYAFAIHVTAEAAADDATQ